MNLKSTIIVFRKELKDVLRDRRTVISMILFPLVLMPLMTVGMTYFMKQRVESIREKVATVGWIAPDNVSALTARVKADPGIDLLTEIADSTILMDLLKEKDLDAVVFIPSDLNDRIGGVLDNTNGGDPGEIHLFSDDTREKSGFAKAMLLEHLKAYRTEIVEHTLTERGLSTNLIRPFVIWSKNVASAKEMGQFIAGMILPYIIILMALTGAMYPAIDLTAGEKERGTLETLLVSGVSRMDIVFGKFLTVFTASMVTAMLALVSISVAGLWLMKGVSEISQQLNFGLEPGSIVILIVAMIPLSAIFSSLLMTLSIFAKSYKEAQSYISPLMIVVILPAMASLTPDAELNRKMALIPIVNVSMLIKEGMMGNVDPGLTAMTMGVNLALAGICLWLVFQMFRRESVLFKI